MTIVERELTQCRIRVRLQHPLTRIHPLIRSILQIISKLIKFTTSAHLGDHRLVNHAVLLITGSAPLAWLHLDAHLWGGYEHAFELLGKLLSDFVIVIMRVLLVPLAAAQPTGYQALLKAREAILQLEKEDLLLYLDG